ncbi:MAG: hypothetical protein AAF585_19875 [Verrucomicrobiota bacterium]
MDEAKIISHLKPKNQALLAALGLGLWIGMIIAVLWIGSHQADFSWGTEIFDTDGLPVWVQWIPFVFGGGFVLITLFLVFVSLKTMITLPETRIWVDEGKLHSLKANHGLFKNESVDIIDLANITVARFVVIQRGEDSDLFQLECEMNDGTWFHPKAPIIFHDTERAEELIRKENPSVQVKIVRKKAKLLR